MKLAVLSIVALAVFWTATLTMANVRTRRVEASHPPSGQFVEVNGRRVHYVEQGDGPPVILIHGANGNVRDFTFSLMGRLAETYRVIAFDRPGLGYSERTNDDYAAAFASDAESPQEQAAHLSEAARALGVERPVVVGHSYGGAVALAWALDHDPAAAVLLAGVANPWPGGLGWVYTVNGTSAGGALMVPIISAWAPRSRLESAFGSVFDPQPEVDGYSEHVGLYMPIRKHAFRANARQVNTLRPHVVDMHERYDTLTVPIELVHGDADGTVPLDIHSGPLAERLPSANLTVLEGVGHMPHHIDPEATVAAIDRAASRGGLR